jgi:hypothetical protein
MSRHESGDEGAEQGSAPAPGVAHELEEAEVAVGIGGSEQQQL